LNVAVIFNGWRELLVEHLPKIDQIVSNSEFIKGLAQYTGLINEKHECLSQTHNQVVFAPLLDFKVLKRCLQRIQSNARLHVFLDNVSDVVEIDVLDDISVERVVFIPMQDVILKIRFLRLLILELFGYTVMTLISFSNLRIKFIVEHRSCI